MSNQSKLQAEETRTFTSWKLDVITAIFSDIRLSDGEKVFAFSLMQHVNARSRIAWPTLIRLAAIMNVNHSTVKRHSAKLEKTGWIKRCRKNKRGSYRYQFDDKQCNAIEEQKEFRVETAKIKEEIRQRNNYESSKLSSQKKLEGAIDTELESANHELYESEQMSSKHLYTEPSN